MSEAELLTGITVDPSIFGGKPILRGRRLPVEHVLGMLAAGDDVQACQQLEALCQPGSSHLLLSF